MPLHLSPTVESTGLILLFSSLVWFSSSFSWLWCVCVSKAGICGIQSSKCYRERMWKTTSIQMERKAIMYFVWCESINSISNTFDWVSFSFLFFNFSFFFSSSSSSSPASSFSLFYLNNNNDIKHANTFAANARNPCAHSLRKQTNTWTRIPCWYT